MPFTPLPPRVLSLSLSLPSFPTLLIRSPPIPSTRPLALWLSRYGSLPSFPPSSSVSFSCPSHPSATSSHSPPLPRFVRLVSPRRPLSSCVCRTRSPFIFLPPLLTVPPRSPSLSSPLLSLSHRIVRTSHKHSDIESPLSRRHRFQRLLPALVVTSWGYATTSSPFRSLVPVRLARPARYPSVAQPLPDSAGSLSLFPMTGR